MLRPDEEDVAAVAFGDDLVLQILGRVLSTQIRFERAAQPRTLLAQPLANQLQLRARMVENFTRWMNLVARLRRLGFE